jgi:hypothetical protein
MGLAEITARVRAAEAAAGRAEGSVRLIAVSKVQPPERVEAVLEAGHRLFGENYVQEAAAKWPDLAGALSGGGTAHDRAVADQQGQGRGRVVRRDPHGRPAFVGGKAGPAGPGARGLPRAVRAGEHRGRTAEGRVSCPPIPMHSSPPAGAWGCRWRADVHSARGRGLHASFARLRDMAARNGLAGLSMGMSGDFEAAIAHGATHVRVGSAIFGARAYG